MGCAQAIAKSMLAVMAGLAMQGCQHRYNEFTAYHDDGRAKPVVAMLSVKDRSGDQLGWDLSRELTQEIRRRLLEEGQLFVVKEDHLAALPTQSLFGPDLSWASAYKPSEFVVALELVEHNRELVDGSTTARSAIDGGEPCLAGFRINQKVRVRVVDIRGSEPRLAYQELISQRHMAPSNEARIDYMNVSYGTPKFDRSALATAHRRLVDNVAKRLDHYILLEKMNLTR
jgi:hypothetical protein